MRTIVKLALWHAIPAVAASLIMSTSHAQASFGVRGGANRAKMTAKDGMLGDVSNRSGFEAGISEAGGAYLNARVTTGTPSPPPWPVISRWMSCVPS
jgi:hypothetical protein